MAKTTKTTTNAKTDAEKAFDKAMKAIESHSAVISLGEVFGTLKSSLASLGNSEFATPAKEEGEADLDYFARALAAKAEFDASQADESSHLRESVLPLLNQWVKEFASPAGKRATITDSVKDRVEAMLRETTPKPAAVIATECGISVPSVSNIKKERCPELIQSRTA